MLQVQNVTEVITKCYRYKMFYYNLKQKFIAKCIRFFIAKRDSFITKCERYYKMRFFTNKMRQSLQNAMTITKYIGENFKKTCFL